MSRRRCALIASVAGLAAAGSVAAYFAMRPRAMVPERFEDAGRAPRLFPDYGDCVIPPNIAPLNFVIREEGSEYRVRIHAPRGEAFVVAGRTPSIRIPPGPWKALLERNRGGEVSLDVYAEGRDGRWRRYETVANRVAREDIDPYLAYRLLKPLHGLYRTMGSYQRDLRNYDERPILRSTTGRRCANCHTFANNRPDPVILHIRGEDGVAMLLGRGGRAVKVDTRTRYSPAPAAYTAWHPSGKLAAFSVNKLAMFHHSTGESRDVFDYASDLGLYSVDSASVFSTRKISDPDRLETFPTWSPDGRYLYFCSTRRTWPKHLTPQHGMPAGFDKVRYDLMRIRYDIQTGTWGELETVLSAKETGKSITEPRISPDGKWLLFCMASYGNFPVYMESSDLYMMDLKTGRYRPLEANSDRSESWHCWSSNSRWIVFASKRRDGVFAKLYFSYIDDDGRAHKPVLLPQKAPTFYDSFLCTYNLPELVTGPVTVSEKELERAIRSSEKGQPAGVVSGATPKATPRPSLGTPDPPGRTDGQP